MLIDTHCHLNDSSKFSDLDSEILLALEQGVGRMVLVGVNPMEWESTLRLAVDHSELFCILGWHPNYTADYDPVVLKELERLARSQKCLAIGEIGLDYHWNYSPAEIQLRALNDQLDLAHDLDLPVVFHGREAYGPLFDTLEDRPRRPYLFHCFTGSLPEARRAIALGGYFGVDGPITYKKSDELRAMIGELPIDRLVLETDAPYLSPVPFRGKTNRPAYIPHICAALGDIFGKEGSEMATITTENATRFFGKILTE